MKLKKFEDARTVHVISSAAFPAYGILRAYEKTA